METLGDILCSLSLILIALGQIKMLNRIEKLEQKIRRMPGGAENEN